MKLLKLSKVNFKTAFAFLCLLFISAQVSPGSLDNHPSPYLRMHQTDPVKWQTWGGGVLQQAKDENKLIYMSIGYFSCHWCHVMQKESYAHPDIGEILNAHFIPVKVDRELRPELDRRMILFVETIRGQAGWPLNVFITPDGHPITGFTYLPKKDFEQVLLTLSMDWVKDYKKLSQSAKDFFEQSETSATKNTLVSLANEHFNRVVDAFVGQAMGIADDLQGGFGPTSKFPSYPQLNSLLKAIIADPNMDSDVVNFFQLTLEAMATKHLMDHVNFGFYRYVTDPDWQTPHFEKMLYDNAQLASLYFDAHKQWPNKAYADVALRTLDYMNQFMANGKGGFNASLSAVDINNIEGGAYYFKAVELNALLSSDDYRYLKNAWGFDNDSVQIQSEPFVGMGVDVNNKAQNQRILKTLQAAGKDPMPVDTKALASWNALALKAFVKASQHSDKVALKQQTQQLYVYLIQNFIKNGKVIKLAGQADSAETSLEDHAQMAHAIQLYANYSGNQQAEKFAKVLVAIAFKNYFNNERWLRNTDSLIPGDKGAFIIQDAVLESPVSLLLETVFLMQQADEKIKPLAQKLMLRLTQDVLDIPYHYSSAIMLRQHESSQSNQ